MARHQSVLLVARDGLIRKIATSGLSMYGYDVLTAEDGERAAEVLRGNTQLTVLVADADLGGALDGLAIARLAREINPQIDVIYTSRQPNRVPPGSMVSGAPTLRDPYHPHQLVGVIAQLRNRSPETVDRSVA
jgi:DNA-binding response OmpR family regulator